MREKSEEERPEERDKKMKQPKAGKIKIRMLGKDWTVHFRKTKDKDFRGPARFSSAKSLIEVLIDEAWISYWFSNLNHEITECVYANQHYRYENNEASSPYVFVFNHDGLSNTAVEIAGALQQVIDAVNGRT